MAAADDDAEEPGLEDETGGESTTPNEAADPQSVVAGKVPADIQSRYEVLSYRNAAVILAETRAAEMADIWQALRSFSITTDMIRRAGGNESDIPKIFSELLRPKGWNETVIRGDLIVQLTWKEQVGLNARGKPKFAKRSAETRRERYLDGHKIDYVKKRVAFDLEWNSKDQTFDRDLYAFNAFFLSGAIDVGILVTRGMSLTPALRTMGQALTKEGAPEFKTDKKTGEKVARMTHEKYGASTTWWGKLVYRLNAGRNGGCPILALGITPKCISDFSAT